MICRGASSGSSSVAITELSTGTTVQRTDRGFIDGAPPGTHRLEESNLLRKESNCTVGEINYRVIRDRSGRIQLHKS
jgi:hypothetical protein